MSIFNQFRLEEWWKPKAGFLLSLMLFAAWIGHASLVSFFAMLIPSIVTLTAIGSLGNILNDLGDLESDARAGKKNRMTAMPVRQRIFWIVMVIVFAVAPWLWLPADGLSYLLLAAVLMLLIAYPLKPFRLKRFMHIAVVVDALYAYGIPSVLAMHTYALGFNVFLAKAHFLVLFVWAMFIGIRHILYHHVSDKIYDSASQTPNIALRYTVYRVNAFIRNLILPAEFIAGLLFIYTCMKSTTGIYKWQLLLLLLFFIIQFLKTGDILKLRPFVSHVIGRFPGDRFYSFWFLLLNTVFLSATVSLWYLFFVVIILLVFSDIRYTGIGGIISDSASCVGQHGKQLVSQIVNYSIYYIRKYILHWSEEKNRGVYYASWLARKEKKENGIIALVNLNFDKYTETYVKGHYEKLPFHCEYYFGNPFPIYHAIDGNLISNYSSLHTIIKSYHFLVSKKEEDLLLAHFQQKKISLILAEFGTTAVTLTDIVARSGIPLIAIFYGYDIWNNAVVSANKEGYKKLFNVAAKVVGVSRDICSRLEQLGCAPEKIEYLPCYVNLDLFQYTDHSQNPPVFLSVGRFSETKSPHLTILAFNEVLQSIPDARLVMIGKDGGGELFESCLILVKALDIEHRVEFAGIQPPEKVYEYMKQARVFVQHSLTTPLHGDKEGTPVAIIEAMASGLPVVSTRHAGIAELITHGENGMLVPEYHYREMAAAMTALCKNDQLVAELGRNAAWAIRNNPLIHENIIHLSKMIFQYKIKP